MRRGQREQTRGTDRGLAPPGKCQISSEMAINASKTANSNINL